MINPEEEVLGTSVHNQMVRSTSGNLDFTTDTRGSGGRGLVYGLSPEPLDGSKIELWDTELVSAEDWRTASWRKSTHTSGARNEAPKAAVKHGGCSCSFTHTAALVLTLRIRFLCPQKPKFWDTLGGKKKSCSELNRAPSNTCKLDLICKQSLCRCSQIKMRSSWRRAGPNPSRLTSLEEETQIQRRGPLKMEQRPERCSYKPSTAGDLQELGGRHGIGSLWLCRRKGPCLPLALGFLYSGTEREWISFIASPPVCSSLVRRTIGN